MDKIIYNFRMVLSNTSGLGAQFLHTCRYNNKNKNKNKKYIYITYIWVTPPPLKKGWKQESAHVDHNQFDLIYHLKSYIPIYLWLHRQSVILKPVQEFLWQTQIEYI